jgi:hypothetical protein
MDYIKISYIIFLLLVILGSLYVYFTVDKEPMVAFGPTIDLSVEQPIPGATYFGGPTPNNREKGVNGYGLDPPNGYYKVDIGGVWKMKPIIPNGYMIDPKDKTKLIVDPKKEKIVYAIQYYKNATDMQLKEGPYTEIPLPAGEMVATETTTLPKNDDNTSKYYRIKLNDTTFKMKLLPNPLPKGYIIDVKDYLIFNPDITEYAFLTFSSQFDKTYDPTKTDTKYYDDIPDFKKEKINNDELGKYYTFDANGQLVREENTDANFSPVLYYIPGSYKYGSSNYVPNYEDSVYLSRTTRLPQPAPVFNTAGMLGGFCTQFKNNTLAIEEKCGALDLNTCASTSCCTLIGGQKCVAGNENGPTNPANYTDYGLKNKDFYYYQGKCYGNCRGN